MDTSRQAHDFSRLKADLGSQVNAHVAAAVEDVVERAEKRCTSPHTQQPDQTAEAYEATLVSSEIEVLRRALYLAIVAQAQINARLLAKQLGQ
jgi:predicted nucleic acid-binding Zn ribbon protein